MLALGTIYAWSLFNQPLAEKFNWRIEDVAFCFGGTISVFLALMGDIFGLKHMTKNYSIIYQGFGLGPVGGMFIGVWLEWFFKLFSFVN